MERFTTNDTSCQIKSHSLLSKKLFKCLHLHHCQEFLLLPNAKWHSFSKNSSKKLLRHFLKNCSQYKHIHGFFKPSNSRQTATSNTTNPLWSTFPTSFPLIFIQEILSSLTTQLHLRYIQTFKSVITFCFWTSYWKDMWNDVRIRSREVTTTFWKNRLVWLCCQVNKWKLW